MDGKLKQIASSLLATNLTDANKLANAAVDALRKRRSALRGKRGKCHRKLSLQKRRVCFIHLQDEYKKLRDEKNLLGDLRKCNSFAEGNIAKLVSCVNEVKERHELMTPEGIPNKPKEVLGKPKLTAIIKAVSGDDALAEREVEEAIQQVRERLESLAGQWSMCKGLGNKLARVGCRQALHKIREENSKERKLLYMLERCGEVYAFEKKARDRCAHLIGRKIFQLVAEKDHHATSTLAVVSNTTKPPVKDVAPSNLDQAEHEKKDAETQIKNRIETILSAMDQCKTLECKLKLHKLLTRARDELNVLGVRYKPREECLKQRAEFQKREFEIRAREHARMYSLHRRASKCEDRHCMDKWQKLELALDAVLGKRRAERHAEWLKIKCYYVLPYELVAPESKTYKTMSQLQMKLHTLYATLSNCAKEDKRCVTDTKFEITLFRGMARRLTSYLNEKSFTNAKRRHKSRARMHRSFSALYRRALDCDRTSCRKNARVMLAHLQSQLEGKRNDWRTGHSDDAADFHTGSTGDKEEGEESLDEEEAD